jgi:hypothetical protein
LRRRSVALAGDDAGQRAYKVARIQLQPQENVFVFKDGWHPGEIVYTTPPSSGSGRRRTRRWRSEPEERSSSS